MLSKIVKWLRDNNPTTKKYKKHRLVRKKFVGPSTMPRSLDKARDWSPDGYEYNPRSGGTDPYSIELVCVDCGERNRHIEDFDECRLGDI